MLSPLAQFDVAAFGPRTCSVCDHDRDACVCGLGTCDDCGKRADVDANGRCEQCARVATGRTIVRRALALYRAGRAGEGVDWATLLSADLAAFDEWRAERDAAFVAAAVCETTAVAS